MQEVEVWEDPFLARSLSLDQANANISDPTEVSCRKKVQQGQSQTGGAQVQHYRSLQPLASRDKGQTINLQGAVQLLSASWREVPQETLI